MARKTFSLRHKLWLYFGLFAIIIVVILWLMQILFLNSFYETMKMAEITRTGKKIVREYNENPTSLTEIILNAHFNYGLSVGVYNEYGNPLYGADVVFYPDSPGSYQVFPEIVSRINRSSGDTVSFIWTNSSRKYNSVIFGAKLKSDSTSTLYLCLNSPLSPMNSTTQVLKTQLILVTIILLIVSLALSYFISKKLSKPISNMTKSVAAFASGDYNVVFDPGGYTEIDQLSEVLNHAASELGKTDSLRRDLVANVSHDLRTPLTIIRSYAEMIRDISGSNPEKRTEHSTVIMDESDRLSLLVTDLLDLSKMESGVLTINIEPFDICETITKAANSFKVLAEKEGYIFNINYDQPNMVLGDQLRIQQVIYNLISNAVNYTGEDKTITVSAEIIDAKIRVSVTDSGNGLSSEEQTLVWDRYYKSSSSHHRLHIGTGIGLSIVKNILLLHKADFGIISEVGHGSTFWFELPLAKNI